MTLNLKIEILKVFSLEFSLSSNKELKKEKLDEKTVANKSADSKPAGSSK